MKRIDPLKKIRENRQVRELRELGGRQVERIRKIRRSKSAMFVFYMIRLVCRAMIFLAALIVYFTDKSILAGLVTSNFLSGFGLPQMLWILLMSGMILHLLPKTFITMGGKKSRKSSYAVPEESFDVVDLHRFVQVMNVKAWTVMLIWLCFNSVFALLYLLDVIGEAEMVLLTFFYFLSDIVCMMVFCPFQTFVMKNRCCVNCRIFDWGHFMMYTPMLFIKSFFSWSLFFTACIVLIRWEYTYAAHPERFWHGSNSALRCENCKDKLCYIKTPLHEVYLHLQESISPEKLASEFSKAAVRKKADAKDS
ncbi:MAG TPA: hypothetical protein PLU75_04020 [Oscillospiraceae bacterium]|jgi:hypothetical protein|nr:hypothetical protein [Oscillospiraceae bacterium]HQQ88648.1 hypothetical protein [Oscillospiraceae bacterium]HRW56742.1 hypothetical protein [Oscillospiraceae bacterium]